MLNVTKSHVAEVMQTDPKQARVILLHALEEAKGNVAVVMRSWGISMSNMRYLMAKLGLSREPTRIRRELRNRFRLPKWEEACT